MSRPSAHVVVIGGGITGLSAAFHLVQDGGADAPHVTLVEADDRLGGKIRTEPIGGRALDMGAEALVTRQPGALALCRELGLGDDLVAPAAGQSFIWLDRLRPLPPRLLAGAPDGAGAIIRSKTLGPVGIARAGLDFVLPRTDVGDDMSIGELVRRRLGDQVLERLIDPLLGGIHAGRCDDLSVRATAPQLAAALQGHRSLTRGLRAMVAKAPPGPPGPPFMTLRGGLVTLVDALAERLEQLDIALSTSVTGLEPLPGGRVRVVLSGGDPIEADHVVLASPAFAAAQILDDACRPAADELRAIDYASVATIAFAFPAADVQLPENGSGLLVPPSFPRTITASTWASSKWAHLAGDPLLIKCSVGGVGRHEMIELPDDELLDRVRADLAEAAGIRAEPVETRIVRFPHAFPQYRVGHVKRVARIDTALAALPGVHLAGAAYRGVGVGSCIRDGAVVAERITERLAPQSSVSTPAA